MKTIKGDHFWDNGEANLLKGLVLYVQMAPTIPQKDKNLAKVYELLTDPKLMHTINGVLGKSEHHASKASFSLFAQSSETVRQGIILGLGTRLQVLQDQAVKQLVSSSDIDLTAPGRHKCA